MKRNQKRLERRTGLDHEGLKSRLRGWVFCSRQWRVIYRLSVQQQHDQRSLSERISGLPTVCYNSRDTPHIGCQGK